MPIWRLQTSFMADTVLPRDRFTITPHFHDQGATTNPDGLCEDLATALSTWLGVAMQIEVKAYDAQGTVPVYPQGEAIRHTAVARTSPCIREVALCLSFFSQRNRHRQRGRLYIPLALISGSTAVPLRPAGATQQKVADLVPIFTNLGGSDVDWCVYSRVDDAAKPISNWFVDDEWDIVRSRGLRSSSRLAGAVSE